MGFALSEVNSHLLNVLSSFISLLNLDKLYSIESRTKVEVFIALVGITKGKEIPLKHFISIKQSVTYLGESMADSVSE